MSETAVKEIPAIEGNRLSNNCLHTGGRSVFQNDIREGVKDRGGTRQLLGESSTWVLKDEQGSAVLRSGEELLDCRDKDSARGYETKRQSCGTQRRLAHAGAEETSRSLGLVLKVRSNWVEF